jgi:hypothetical protein
MTRFTATSLIFVGALALSAAGCKDKGAKEAPKATDTEPVPAAAGEGAEAAAPRPAEPSPEPGGAATYTTEQACDKAIAMFEQMGAAVSNNKGNCDGMGEALQKVVDDNKEFMAWGKESDKDPAKKKEFDEKCGPRMTPVMEKMGASMEGAQACGTNEKVKAALSSLE